MQRLAPLMEEPTDEQEEEEERGRRSTRSKSWKKWIKTHLQIIVFPKKPDMKLLLSVMGCPLFPVPPLSKISLHQVSSSAQYIIQQFAAATGCKKLAGEIKNTFVTGKITMSMVNDINSSPTVGNASSVSHKGCFVMWQMLPEKWLIELVGGGHKVAAGSDGEITWRYTPWLGDHAAKGAIRPLRRALQGLDPLTISSVFSSAQFVGEKEINGKDCFILKLSTDQIDLSRRSDSTAEMIKHVAFGYFSQKSGLLICLEDSSLTRIQIPGTMPTYWETSMSSWMEDYRAIEGSEVVIAHSGRTDVLISRFGETLKGGISVTRMEERWTIDDVAFDVPGLSVDCFIPPKEMKMDFHHHQQQQDGSKHLPTF
ncbi:PREDICTED: uncharacterized protein LOC104708441 [Camelina sativa]|uniref:Uncharacterized protein LOC104708441 n=1 Tax=Camelina sativa TaxID=90675 RepID=A0ABM0TAI1_CAMSA|nr:PREDICTED: uncharacterized protein LOC104708441 [Camelina sativa]